MKVVDLGITDFLDTYKLQMDLVKEVSLGISEDTLLITEHNPVITIGRKGSRNNILRSAEDLSLYGIAVLNIDRGGDVTYHGPGQIIAYPIFKLENEAQGIHYFLDFLEEVGRHFLMQYNFMAESISGLRGIWVKGKKIGSIGIGVKKWVTYHGLAMNINSDLAHFSFIRPCGIEGVKMTSLKDLLGYELDIYDAKDRLKFSFKEISILAEAVSKN